jgi:pimeloyl-ACP methyl ester carboxylesterase
LPKDASEPKIDPNTQTRSLGGSVKIFFQKVVSKKLGREFQYPLLDMATDIRADGFTYLRKVHSEKDYGFVLDQIARKVEDKNVKNIAVFVHGIIGDTETMPQSLVLGKDAMGNPLLNKYDAVLTLDYENLNTPIEANSQFFKERLEHIGLKSGHDKNVHIYAHSMGGLVSRYMIENLRGDEIANHLIMLGTPNGGSPMSALKDWIQMAISMALSKIALFAWATAPMVFLFNKTMKEIGVSLKQLNGNEPFLQNLAKTAQPQTPYTIIAGNTALTALLSENSEENKALKRLLGKLQSKVLDEFLFGSPNDIAVGLESIKNVKWVKEEEVIYSACDHMSYFSTPEGTKAMAEAISRAKFL